MLLNAFDACWSCLLLRNALSSFENLIFHTGNEQELQTLKSEHLVFYTFCECQQTLRSLQLSLISLLPVKCRGFSAIRLSVLLLVFLSVFQELISIKLHTLMENKHNFDKFKFQGHGIKVKVTFTLIKYTEYLGQVQVAGSLGQEQVTYTIFRKGVCRGR